MFYSQLRTAIDGLPRKEKLIILGDFNARVGADWPAWEGVLGRHGLLLKMTVHSITYNLHITNSNFQLPPRNRTSWMHPRSKHWHLIDYIIVRQEGRSDVRITKSLCGEDCAKNHQYRLHPWIGPQDQHSVATEWPPLFLGYAASQSSMSLGLAGAVGAEQLDLV